ncbi:MAG TPA: serine hydrolase [Longimicrobiaceae bacterium]|nr:serine hydrolase [Longimicrobiaceae bacterium]
MPQRLAAALFAACAWLAAPALAQSPADSLARQVDAMFAQYNRQPSPGLAIAVVRDGRVVLRRGYGLADVEGRVPITPETAFDLTSLAKQFTGASVAMLALEGKIRPGDDIRRYLPELHDFGRPITLSHLLHHTSGIRDWTVTLPVAGVTYDDPISLDRILAMAYRQQTLNFVPGAEHTYSNTGYNLLAEMVQRVTRQPFRRFAEARLFAPLGMTHTHVHDDDGEAIANRAYGYQPLRGGWRRTPDHLTAVGSSSVYSTADDLAKWMLNFDRGTVGGRAMLELMLTRGRLNDGTDVPYGFGLENGVYRGQPMFTHSGGWASFDTYIAYLPRQRFGVVVLANSPVVDAQSAVIRITDLYLRNELDPVPPPAAATCAPPRTSPAALDAYAGLYRLGPGWLLRVRREGAGLTAQATHEDRFPMVPRCGSTFRVPAYDNSDVEFISDATGRVTRLEYRGIDAPKLVESPAPAPASLSQYAGEYVSAELGTGYRVVVANGGLELRHARYGAIPLTWLWRDEFGSATWFLKSVTFERSASGRVTGFVVNGSERARDMRFRKR